MVAGIVSAVVLHRLKRVRETLDPLFATYYAIPVFAFYPLLIVVFGLGDLPQILIGFMPQAYRGRPHVCSDVSGVATEPPMCVVSVSSL